MDKAATLGGPVRVSSTDWLKLVGIAAFLIDHIGLFFIDDADLFRTIGRLAAPIFFFFIGFARSRQIPLAWIVFGLALTSLDAWLDDFDSLSFNILLNFALARLVLRGVDIYASSPLRLAAVAVIALALIPWTDVIEYGAEGWLWTLFGFAQRRWRDGDTRFEWARFGFAAVAAGTYVIVETGYHELSGIDETALYALIVSLTAWLLLFERRISPVQPPHLMVAPILFASRYSLIIYAFSLFAMQVIAHVIE